ncbi:MAG TPA: hypothetical protein DCX32_01495 [Candidatus Moranbacteria bacterium]|nr:MAG: hypothetical protein UW95_C0007G0038 [Parcubacteria group bacterium GW2011_GWC1_45_14]HAV11195.1 hypothetical protein [Candidatus Moranbacteria bacterium]
MFERFFGGGAKKPQPGEISPEVKSEIVNKYKNEKPVDLGERRAQAVRDAVYGKVNPKGEEGRGKMNISKEEASDATRRIREGNTGPFIEISPTTEDEMETQIRGMEEFLDDFGHYEEVLKKIEGNLNNSTEDRHRELLSKELEQAKQQAILEIETFMDANKVRQGDDARLIKLRQRAIGMRNSLQKIGGLEKAA